MGANSSEGTVTKIFDYHLTHDKVRRVIVTSQRTVMLVLDIIFLM